MDNILLADTNARKAKRRSRRFIEKHDKNIKVKEVPADNYGYNYGRRDINGKAKV